ncbi:sigma-70 family RNA polymerase sigma factor [Pelagicoccus sp. SDUM812003]|uniref:sigma-70 family RNA polymerase sigma factor n=1 Tax=Pelagicoccus sp. SDUM812003 TaxID=3041267 RepID=UPI00280FEC28|nr:sigma-70 family RNA polymerase sigma factor [Pelagicoccus sp. SDUM812003]MDQ8203462.1 sigma-70 family RNA polymerase sigma factor [Pelagicoccus sp. SDUM812003]
MPTISRDQSAELPANDPANRPAFLRIARVRSALDWMITKAEWEGEIALAASQLGFKGQRRGISLRKALLSLPLQQKFEVILQAMGEGELTKPTHAESKRLARHWAVTSYVARTDFAAPSASHWQSLRSLTRLRIAAKYQGYKEDQSVLYGRFEPLVATCLPRGRWKSSGAEDAMQEGRLALLRAIDHADPNRCFASYARHWIKRAMTNFAMRQRLPVKAPINLISQALRGDPEDSTRRIDAHSELREALRAGVLQLDFPQNEAEAMVEAGPCPAALAEANDERELVCSALAQLTEKQRQVIQLRYGVERQGADHSLAHVSRETGITRQQVHRREQRALQTLAQILRAARAESQPTSSVRSLAD